MVGGGIRERRLAGGLLRVGRRGDADGSPGLGLFYRDVRHLSAYRLRLGGMSPVPLASWVRGLEAEFMLAAGVGPEGIGELRLCGVLAFGGEHTVEA